MRCKIFLVTRQFNNCLSKAVLLSELERSSELISYDAYHNRSIVNVSRNSWCNRLEIRTSRVDSQAIQIATAVTLILQEAA